MSYETNWLTAQGSPLIAIGSTMVLMLDTHGVLLTLLFGVIIYFAGGMPYLASILIFLIIAVSVTKYENIAKKELGVYEHERGWENVFSNGLIPTALAVLNPWLGFMPYVCSIAAITADKFGSEIGVIEKNAFDLRTFKTIKSGKSGAVSVLGTLASLSGSTIVGLSAMLLFNVTPTTALIIGIIGFLGSFVDSIFGIFEEMGIGTKATTNLACSIAGALLGYWFLK
ncbi:MAG: DUF92 domain-containing protein [Candidatus Micrarchaeota archaeon]